DRAGPPESSVRMPAQARRGAESAGPNVSQRPAALQIRLPSIRVLNSGEHTVSAEARLDTASTSHSAAHRRNELR
ncbi:MAG: hypothetical protein RIK87_30375, partial [Fuerstiella sp.]